MIREQLFKVFGDLQKILSNVEEYPDSIKKKDSKDVDRSIEVIKSALDRIGEGVKKNLARKKNN